MASLLAVNERCLAPHWQLKALGSALAFNVLYSWSFNQGLLDVLDGPPAAPPGRTAAVALVALLIATHLLPFLASGPIWLLEQTLGRLCDLDRAATIAFQTGAGRVPLRRAIENALFQRDRYWTDRIEKELAAQARVHSHRHEHQRRAFAVLTLLAFDLHCPRALIPAIARSLDLSPTIEVFGTLYLALILSWCLLVSRGSSPMLGSIYHPALAQDLAARIEASRSRRPVAVIATPPLDLKHCGRRTETISRRRS